MLEQCESFPRAHYIWLNASNTKYRYMNFKHREIINVASPYFKDLPINCVHEYDLLGITLSSNITSDNDIEKKKKYDIEQ